MAADLTLDSLVRDLLLGQGESGTHLVARFTTYALSALDQLGYAAPSATAKHVRLSIGARREVLAPDDLALLLSVAGQSGDYLVPLVPDERLSELSAADAAPVVEGDDMFAPLPIDDGYAPEANQVLGWTMPDAWGGAWGAAWPREAGSYRYFPRERLLRFSTALPAHLGVALAYLPSTTICGADTPISPLVRDAVDNYCRWQYALSKEKIGLAREYESGWRKARTLWKLQHGGTDPRAVARLSEEAAFGYGRGPYIN